MMVEMQAGAALTTKLSRSVGALVRLLAARNEGDRVGQRRSAEQVAESLLRGSRDRGSGARRRTRVEMEERESPLRNARPGVLRTTRCEARKRTKKAGSGQEKSGEKKDKATM